MTDSDGVPGAQPPPERRGAPGDEHLPSSGDEHLPGSGWPGEPYVPGPRPGLYPPPAHPPASPVAGPADGAGARLPAAGTRSSGSRRRPSPAPAQQQLMARISAARKARHQRAMVLLFGAVSTLVMLTAGSAWVLTSYVSSSIGRINAGTSGTPASGPLNILIAGVDIRSGLTARQQAELHVGHAVSSNSDTLMVVHIPADHHAVTVVSLPRDSWVDIPGHGMNKINAAFGLGGPSLMVRTVEHATGLSINDYIEVNFLGFVRVIDALGGVNVCVPYAVNDPYSGLRLSAGRHHVHGITALEFARDRHSFAQSDLARVSDQQQLLSSMLSEAVSSGTVADPVRLARFLSAAAAAVRVDQGFNITSLASQLRGVRPATVSFTTVPLASASYQAPTGQAAVLWDKAAAGALFAALKNDHAVARKHHHRARVRRGQVSIDVYNGTMIGGLSAGTGTQLAALGFSVHGSGLTWSAQDVSQTLIEYPAGERAAARLVHAVLPAALLRQVNGLSRIRIVLGVSGYAVTAGQAGPAQSAAPGGQRTAAQAACR